jgi:hypothetical protein
VKGKHIELRGLVYHHVACARCGVRYKIGRLPDDPPQANEFLLCGPCRKKTDTPASLMLTKADLKKNPLLPF